MENEAKKEWLAKLMSAFEGRLLRYAQRFVAPEVARELVQECFVRLWKENPQNLMAREREWLFCVCRNLAIDSLRKSRKILLVEVEGVAVPQAEEALQQQEEQSELQTAILALPPLQREVLRLKFQESMSYQEISKVTGHSISYVGVLIHKGMTDIRKKISKVRGAG